MRTEKQPGCERQDSVSSTAAEDSRDEAEARCLVHQANGCMLDMCLSWHAAQIDHCRKIAVSASLHRQGIAGAFFARIQNSGRR
eukprot:SAG25_NODE_25_length_21717_cov_29.421778_6_plen_84_part_00